MDQTDIDNFFEIAQERKRKSEKDKPKNTTIIYNSPFYWIPFYEKYPNAHGYYSVSRVGFSSDRKFALFNLTKEDSIASFSRNYLLKKIKNKWQVIKYFGTESF